MPRNTTLAPNCPQHYSTNQTAEWPHEKPVSAKLSAAAAVAADYARLCGQGRLIVKAFDVEIPDGARATQRDWRVKVCAIEGRKITRRTPELSRHAQDNLFSRLLREHPEAGIDQGLERDLLISR